MVNDDRAEGAASLLSVTDLGMSLRARGAWHDVLDHVNFDITRGETIALVGESGSGKSVTALSIMRLMPARGVRYRGRIQFEGTDLLAASAPEMCRIRGNRIAMIFQEPMTSLNPVMSVGRQIAEAIVTHRRIAWEEAGREAVQLLDRVRIASARSRADDYPHQFSGGMRQRVMIAMAIACKPSLLIADEPTTALDVTIQAEILDLMCSLQREEGMALLFITHDLGVVAEIADRALVMKEGRIVEARPVDTLFSNAGHPYSRGLLASVPRLGSMNGEQLPRRFPIVDVKTGEARAPAKSQPTVSPADILLKVENLSTRFDVNAGLFAKVKERVHAVEDVSFELCKGETLGLVGESGSGKSTIGRSIARLISPSAGRITLAGHDAAGPSPGSSREMARHVQMIFQDPYASLNPRMRIGDALAEPLIQHRICNGSEARRRVTDLLERVGLSVAAADRFPHEFSGGQRQRICIARSLALNPSLIVADEAVSALDTSTKAQIVNLMIDLQQAMRVAYLFISHDMAVVERISHRVAVMHLGEIVEIGPREAIFSNPRHAYTQALIAAVPLPDPRRRRDRLAMNPRLVRGSMRRGVDYVPPARHYKEVSPGHLVQVR